MNEFFLKVGYGDYYALHIETLDDNSYENSQNSNPVNRRTGEVSMKRNKSIAYYLKEFWNCIKSDPDHKSEMIKRAHFKGINGVSKCDRVARIFFPSSFCLLNILYWFKYYQWNS